MHARVEDAIRTGQHTGIGTFPSHLLGLNRAWLTAATLLAWLRTLALDGDLAKAEPKTLRYRILHAAGRLVRSGLVPVEPTATRPASRALGRPKR